MTGMFKRYVRDKVELALKDTPVVMIAGPRQCGKTTLAKQVMGEGWVYITFDDPTQYEIALNDPVGFIRNLPSKHVVLDEVQRVPELFVCMKQVVDENRYPGRFLLTGSSNALLIPKLSDSLAGRMEIISLMPLSICEINGTEPTFLQKLINKDIPATKTIRIRRQLIQKLLSGGFPEPLARSDQSRRATWYKQYLNSLIQRDIKDIANIENADLLPRFMKLLANNVGQILNQSEIGSQIGLTRRTVAKYIRLLEQLFLVTELPAWHRNENKRLIKSSKIHLIDSGLLSSLRRLNQSKLEQHPEIFGHVLENFIYCELLKQSSWLDEPVHFSHYRDKDQVEVDLVLESSDNDLIGIEIKSTATLRVKDFQGLQRLQRSAENDFLVGIILYDGDHTTAYGENLYAVPIGAIWDCE